MSEEGEDLGRREVMSGEVEDRGRREVMSEEVEDRGQCKRRLRSNGGDVLGISSN